MRGDILPLFVNSKDDQRWTEYMESRVEELMEIIRRQKKQLLDMQKKW
jgi:hypothetical protein